MNQSDKENIFRMKLPKVDDTHKIRKVAKESAIFIIKMNTPSEKTLNNQVAKCDGYEYYSHSNPNSQKKIGILLLRLPGTIFGQLVSFCQLVGVLIYQILQKRTNKRRYSG